MYYSYQRESFGQSTQGSRPNYQGFPCQFVLRSLTGHAGSKRNSQGKDSSRINGAALFRLAAVSVDSLGSRMVVGDREGTDPGCSDFSFSARLKNSTRSICWWTACASWPQVANDGHYRDLQPSWKGRAAAGLAGCSPGPLAITATTVITITVTIVTTIRFSRRFSGRPRALNEEAYSQKAAGV